MKYSGSIKFMFSQAKHAKIYSRLPQTLPLAQFIRRANIHNDGVKQLHMQGLTSREIEKFKTLYEFDI